MIHIPRKRPCRTAVRWMILPFAMSSTLLFSFPISERKIRTLYASLDPRSVPQHLALYELCPHTPIGQQALHEAWNLLSKKGCTIDSRFDPLPLPLSAIDAVVGLINQQPRGELPVLEDQELEAIETLANQLPHRQLKGALARNEEEILALSPDEIDIGRGVFLTQMGSEEDAFRKIRSYEAMIDLMALQLLTKISFDATAQEKIRAINEMIFFDMGFRFPPHSLHAKDIDLYTFLPSVLDSRHGVCLGVSILYLCLAQRLDLSLEAVTPPGHIYIRYRNREDEVINIETTARGIHLDSKEYLSIDTRSLQERDAKEVVGLVHINQASVYWKEKKFAQALESYKKAFLYLPDDMLLKELMAYNELFLGNRDKGEKLLREVEGFIPDYSVSKNTLIEDYFSHSVDQEGIQAVFMPVDETRESILEKKKTLEKILKTYPRFREGLLSLAIAWLQLHREKEALEVLERYHAIESDNPTAEYYLTVIHAQRFNYTKAWKHFRHAQRFVNDRNHDPQALKHLQKQLSILCPEYKEGNG
ncbi:MAG: transglutaminase family protein [Waddliaceae bacterium]